MNRSLRQTNTKRLYDLTLVTEIARGNMDFVKSLCMVFIITAPVNLAEMRTNTATGDWERVAKLAHKLKSTIDTMHIEEARRLVREIEYSARENENRESIPDKINRIQALVEVATREIREDFRL